MSDRWTLDGDAVIEIARDTHGVPHVRATTEADLYRGLGFCHGTDRALPILLMRIVGAGRGAELLDSGDDVLASDRFFRRLNLAAGAAEEVAKIPRADLALVEAYADGINRALAAGAPWELRLLGYRPEPWSPTDSIVASRLLGYVALAQSQGDMERLLVEMVQAGVPRGHLGELFPGLLDELDVDLIRTVRLGTRIVPESLRWTNVVPRAVASNNWVVAPARTASSHALLANDPHLETNRLPPIWYEIVAELGARYCLAATMPGMPAFLLGRTNDLAWGATYSFMDAIDSWVEDCRDGRYRRVVDGRDTWVPFRTRVEVIRRGRLPDETVTFYENDHGVLDGDPFTAGRYLTTRWASASGTGARSLGGALAILHAPDVASGMAALGSIETAWNWVLADRHGSIGYQMSGLMPRRRAGANGLVPLPGWDAANDWQGFVPHEELPRAMNPPDGILVTANDDLNHLGRASPINLPMGSYRADRIRELLRARDDWTVADTERMHMDVHSPQAVRFMDVLRPLLPDTPAGATLRAWDCGYDLASEGAPLFEALYRALLVEVFGAVSGEDVLAHLAAETGILTDFYANFDRVLTSPSSVWFGDEGRDRTWARIAARVLADPPRETWGERQQVTMRHLLLGGRLPWVLGFDHGPIQLRGGRATIHQGQIYRSGGRDTSFAPSYRFITDLGSAESRTAIAGGPSDRRFSRWYTSDVADWLAGRFKTLRADPHDADG